MKRSSSERKQHNQDGGRAMDHEWRRSDSYSSDGSPCERFSTPRRSRNTDRPHSSGGTASDRYQMASPRLERSFPEKPRKKKSTDRNRSASRNGSRSPKRKGVAEPEDPASNEKAAEEDNR